MPADLWIEVQPFACGWNSSAYGAPVGKLTEQSEGKGYPEERIGKPVGGAKKQGQCCGREQNDARNMETTNETLPALLKFQRTKPHVVSARGGHEV